MHIFDQFIQPAVTITIDSVGNKRFVLGYRGPGGGEKPFRLPDSVNDNSLESKMILLRVELSKWAMAYDDLLLSNSTDRVTCDPLKVREMWTCLAEEGRAWYRLLFDRKKQSLVDLAQGLRSLNAGSTIELDALDAPLPWSLLYEGDIPPASDPNYLKKLIPQFWGIRYQLTLHPFRENSTFTHKPYLSNNDGTRLTVAINQKKDEEDKTGQMSFFTEMKEKFSGRQGVGGLVLGTSRKHVIDNLRTREEPQHLLYFYCHHEKGGGEMTLPGTQDFLQKTQIIMEGDNEGVITLDELTNNSDIEPFKFRPVIFLNSCQSSKLRMGDPTSFMTYFIRELDSWNFMGTEADIPASFADEFGKAFVRSFLKGQGVGKILFDLRKKYATEHLNPFGLYYTLVGRGDIRLQHRVPGVA